MGCVGFWSFERIRNSLSLILKNLTMQTQNLYALLITFSFFLPFSTTFYVCQMMSSSNGSAKVMILIGEAFVAVDEEYATECMYAYYIFSFEMHFLNDFFPPPFIMTIVLDWQTRLWEKARGKAPAIIIPSFRLKTWQWIYSIIVVSV